jgi:hypothetical protein
MGPFPPAEAKQRQFANHATYTLFVVDALGLDPATHWEWSLL